MAKILQHLKEFGKSTSVKGIARMMNSKSLFLRCIWLLAVILGATAACYQLTIFLTKYFTYSVYTTMSVCSSCDPPFPDVTICNLNPVALVSEYKSLWQFDEYIVELSDLIKQWTEDIGTETLTTQLNTDDNHLYKIYGTLFSLAGYLHNVDPVKALRLMHGKQSHALVQNCTWYDWENQIYEKEDCTATSQKYHYTNDYYICTTIQINSTEIKTPITKVKGLEALLFINDFVEVFVPSYEPHILHSQARGARILIHPRGTLPDISKGFNIPPGNEVSVYLSANEHSRQREPYSECTDKEWLEEDINGTTGFASKHIYTDTAAMGLCQQENIMRTCNCFHPSLPLTEHLYKKYDTRGCNTFLDFDNSDDFQEASVRFLEGISCYLFSVNSNHNNESAEKGVTDRLSNCTFKQPCKEYKYEYDISFSPWPHEMYQMAFFCKFIFGNDCNNIYDANYTSKFGKKFEVYKNIYLLLQSNYSFVSQAMDILKETNLISRNFINLKVIFAESGIIQYCDVPAVTIEMLFGTMGGMLNLWIGITFFTFIEVLEFCYKLFKDLMIGNPVKESKVSDKNLNKVTYRHGLSSTSMNKMATVNS